MADHPPVPADRPGWATTRQVSGLDPEGRFVLSVLARRTYHIDARGRLAVADEQLPLVDEVETADGNAELLVRDTDLYPLKPASDVVIAGHAYAPRRASTFEASVAIGKLEKRVLVVGNRRASLSTAGEVTITEPEAIESVRLGYDHAYGGRDRAAEEKYGNPFEQLAGAWPDAEGRKMLRGASNFAYPRNPCGRGFILEPSRVALDGLALPNLEDPDDRLTPERLCAGTLRRWPLQPLPCSLDWFGLLWFPRCAHCGLIPEHDPFAAPLPEVARGYLPTASFQPRAGVDALAANGASPGLVVPHLRGDETLVLTHLHPRQFKLAIELPAERPAMRADGRKGKMLDTVPVIHTVLIEPDENRVSIVWRGSAPALRPYLPQELARMPFEVSW